MIRVATIVEQTEAEGPGHRFALWVQGCAIRCPGCCNPEMFDHRKGTEMSVDEIVARIPAAVEGVTFLGGEPFEQADELAEVAARVKAMGKTVMVFSGHPIDSIRAKKLFPLVDLLVDAPYDETQPEPKPPEGRRWIGSRNQTMHFLTDAYREDDPRMREANTIEIRVGPNGLLINGWPTAQQLVRRK